jgi:hypothetical protein
LSSKAVEQRDRLVDRVAQSLASRSRLRRQLFGVNQFGHHPNERANHLAARAVVGAFEAFWTAEAWARAAKLGARSAPAAARSPSTEKRRFQPKSYWRARPAAGGFPRGRIARVLT